MKLEDWSFVIVRKIRDALVFTYFFFIIDGFYILKRLNYTFGPLSFPKL